MPKKKRPLPKTVFSSSLSQSEATEQLEKKTKSESLRSLYLHEIQRIPERVKEELRTLGVEVHGRE